MIPAVYVYLLREHGAGDEVLLQLRQGTGFRDGHWAAGVAGHVERGESVYAAAEREAREEVGVTRLDLVPWCAMQRTGTSTGTGTGVHPLDERVDYFFVARRWSGTPRVREPQKSAGLAWCRLDELARLTEPVVPHELRVLETLRTGSAPPFLVEGFVSDRGVPGR